MTTLQKKSLQFNPEISVSNDGGHLSSDSGILLVQEFLNRIHFGQTVTDHLHFHDQRKFFIHSPLGLMKQELFQMIAGYSKDPAADSLRKDPILTLSLSKEA